MAENGTGSVSGDVCSELSYDTLVFKLVAILRVLIGVLSFLVCMAVAVLLVVLKKHYFFDQRLVLYLAIASLFRSLSYITGRIDFYGSRPISDQYCYFAGFLETYTSCVELLAILSISINMFVRTVLKLPRDKLELFYLTSIFFLPLLWCWVPFLYEAYATAGPWCGIRILEPADCEVFETGNLLRYLFWHSLVFLFIVIALSVSVTVVVRLRTNARKWEGPTCDPNRQANVQKLREGLLLGPVIYVLLKIPIFVTDVYDYTNPLNPSVTMWFVRVCTSPLAGAIILLMYFLDSETRKWLSMNSFKAAVVRCCRGNAEVEGVTPYDCEFHFMYGDSLEGTIMRRKPVRHGASTCTYLPT